MSIAQPNVRGFHPAPGAGCSWKMPRSRAVAPAPPRLIAGASRKLLSTMIHEPESDDAVAAAGGVLKPSPASVTAAPMERVAVSR